MVGSDAYRFLRLYRLVGYDRMVVEEELKKLIEFIKKRASQNKDLSYITVTMVHKSDVDGVIVLEGKESSKLVKEIEIIKGFIDANLESIGAEIVDEKSIATMVPIPGRRRFFLREEAA